MLLGLVGCAADSTFRSEPTEQQSEPYTVEAHFVGIDALSERVLLRAIEDYCVDLSRDPSRTTVVLDAEFDIADAYRQAGYADVTVTHDIVRDDEARRIDLTFEVVEGPEVTAELRLVGNEHFEAEDLRAYWVRRSSGALGLGDPLFVENDVLAFRSSLEAFYKTRGYRDVEVLEPTIRREPGASTATIEIQIREGEPWLLTRIDLADELAAAIGPKLVDAIQAQTRQPTIAAAQTLEDVRYRILGELRRTGYPEPDVRLQPQNGQTERSVELHVLGQPGPRGRIVELDIRGNEHTADWFLRGYFELEGEPWYHGPSIDRARRELYLTGLFKSVDIDHEWLDTAEPSVDPADPAAAGPPPVDGRIRLVVRVEEDDSRAVDVLLGYGSYELARGMLRFEERNVFGTGRRFSVEGRLSTTGYRGAVTVTDPRLFGTRNQLTISGDVFEREEPSFVDKARGVTTAVSRDLGGGLKARAGYSFRTRSGVESNLVDVLENYTQGNAFADLRLERRDSVLYPRSGYLLELQADADDPALGSDIDFDRLRFSASGYVPIWRDLHLALRASTGALWPQEGSDRIPLQERFFNGGESTVRSFRESRLGPRGADNVLVGGEFRNVFTAELRLPVRGLLEAAVFVDAGNVGQSVDAYQLRDLRYAIGAGLRLQLPIGPVRVDGAFNPDRDPGEDEWVVHLSVGYPF